MPRDIMAALSFDLRLNDISPSLARLASEGKITFPMLDQAFRNLTAQGGQFFNMMAEQSATAKGLWSTLQDNINELFLAFGKPLNDALKPVLSDAIAMVGTLQPLVAGIGTSLGAVITATRDFIANIGTGTGAFDKLLASMGRALGGLGDVIAVPLNAIKAAIGPMGEALIVMLTPMGVWLHKTLEAGALFFGRTIMQQMSEVMAKMPRALVGDAPTQLNAGANAAGKAGNAARAEAQSAAATIKPAANMAMKLMGDAMTTAASTFKQGTEDLASKAKDEAEGSEASRIVKEGRKSSRASVAVNSTGHWEKKEGAIGKGVWVKDKQPEPTDGEAQLREFYKDKGGYAGKGGDKAPGLDEALAGKTSPKAPVTMSDPFRLKQYQMPPAAQARQATDQAFQAMGQSPGSNEALTADGRKKIISKRDGSTKARTREQDSLYKPFGTPGFDSLYGGKVPVPKLTSPGTAKRQDQERRDQAATVSRGGSGGGGDKPRWDLVASIEKRFAGLATA